MIELVFPPRKGNTPPGRAGRGAGNKNRISRQQECGGTLKGPGAPRPPNVLIIVVSVFSASSKYRLNDKINLKVECGDWKFNPQGLDLGS
jgi:hypothetical protein